MKILDLLHYANLAYGTEAGKWFVKNKQTGAYAIMDTIDKTSIIAFRGTDSFVDWLHNLMRWRTPKILTDGTEYNIHAGFEVQLQSIFPSIMKKLIDDKPNTIYIVGHSLGGGIATLAGADIAYAFPDTSVHVLSIGGPRCVDALFEKWYKVQQNLTIHRIGFTYDIVTRLPYFGYKHVGKLIPVLNQYNIFNIGNNHSINTYGKCKQILSVDI